MRGYYKWLKSSGKLSYQFTANIQSNTYYHFIKLRAVVITSIAMLALKFALRYNMKTNIVSIGNSQGI